MAWCTLDIMMYFLTLWHTFWYTFSLNNIPFDIMMYFPYFLLWCHNVPFDVMTSFLTSWHKFWHHNVFYIPYVMMTFWRYDILFDVMICFPDFLVLSRTWHDALFDIMMYALMLRSSFLATTVFLKQRQIKIVFDVLDISYTTDRCDFMTNFFTS